MFQMRRGSSKYILVSIWTAVAASLLYSSRAVLAEPTVVEAGVSSTPLREKDVVARVVFGSCNRPELQSAWRSIADREPDKVVLLGDNVYSDSISIFGHKEGDLENILRSYESLVHGSAWKYMRQKVGSSNILATWDDHDYGVNNGDGNFQHRNDSMNVFKLFFTSETLSLLREEMAMEQDGVYSSDGFMAGGLYIKIILLDTRSHLNLKRSQGENGKDAILGSAQWTWLERELSQYADVILLGSSIQVLPDDKLVEEGWGALTGDQNARKRLLRAVSTANTRNIFMLSGDVHYAEVSQAVCSVRMGQDQDQDQDLGSSNATETNLDDKGASPRSFTCADKPRASINRHLWEFTSSGLTHTFVHKANDVKDDIDIDVRGSGNIQSDPEDLVAELDNSVKANTDEPDMELWEKVQREGGRIVSSRGYLAQLVFDAYQAWFPSSYREHRFKDMYKHLNYGMIDIIKIDMDESPSSKSSPTYPSSLKKNTHSNQLKTFLTTDDALSDGKQDDSADDKYMLRFSVVGEADDIVMERLIEISLPKGSSFFERGNLAPSVSSVNSEKIKDPLQLLSLVRGCPTVQKSYPDLVCEPIRDVVKMGSADYLAILQAGSGSKTWRWWLFVGLMLLFPLCLIIIPGMIFLWLIFASALYLYLWSNNLLDKENKKNK